MRSGGRDATRRSFLGISRGTLKQTNDDGGMQSVDIKGYADETPTQVEHMQPYGLSAVPHAGAEVVYASLSGNRDHVVVLMIDDRRFRLKSLKPGEVALYDDQGQTVTIGRDGLTLKSPMKVVVDAPEVHLGGEGGKPVAVEGSVDSAGHPIISSMATKVFAV